MVFMENQKKDLKTFLKNNFKLFSFFIRNIYI